MRSSSRWIACVLLVIGLLLCAGNLWFTAARTTIPLSLELTVVDKEIRHEKHPGFDDIHLLQFSDGTSRVVDGSIYDSVVAGQIVSKKRWSPRLLIGAQSIALDWSADVRGMAWVMPVAALMFFVLAVPPRTQSRNDAHG